MAMPAESRIHHGDPDRGLVQALGSMADLERLYKAEHDGLVRLAFLLTGSRGVAEEVVHDAFLSLFEHRHQARNPGAYLRKILINNCRSRQRRSVTERSKLELVGRDPLRSAAVFQPEVAELWEVVASLRPKQRAVVVLRFYADLPLEEISAVLGMRLGTVKSTLHRSLTAMRKELS